MQESNFLIKPASGACNMRCRYCFYADEMERREKANYGVMDGKTAEMLLKRAFSSTQRKCTFVFQGGEPTLAGLPFFQRFTAMARELNTQHLTLSYAIQTNGYALDESWMLFLAKENFLVGLSLDGYAELHDLYRLDAQGQPTAKQVLYTAEQLDKYKIPYNVLSVVTAQSAKHAEKIYRFFKNRGMRYQQYIPCMDALGCTEGQESFSLTPQLYGMFLNRMFDLWYEDAIAGKEPYNRFFDNLLGMLLGEAPEACGMLGRCTEQMVIEADGGVYPCDFYALDRYRLGNVNTDTLEQMNTRREQLGFIRESQVQEEACLRCRWHFLCRGGCRRDRDEGERLGRNRYCEAYQAFFEYAYPRLNSLAERLSASRFESGMPSQISRVSL